MTTIYEETIRHALAQPERIGDRKRLTRDQWMKRFCALAEKLVDEPDWSPPQDTSIVKPE